MEKLIKFFGILFIAMSCSTKSIYIEKIETYPTFYKVYFKDDEEKGFFTSSKRNCNPSEIKDSIITGKKLRIKKEAIWWDDPKAVMYRDSVLVWDSKSEYMIYNSRGFCGLNTINFKETKVRKNDLMKLLKEK